MAAFNGAVLLLVATLVLVWTLEAIMASPSHADVREG